MRIAVLCPNVSSNSLVRTYPIAKVLARRHELQVLGFRSGADVFEPYRDEFEYETILMKRLPGFLPQLWTLVDRIRADALFAFKPLPASLWLGLLARRRLGIPLFLDVEDWEAGWYYDVGLRHTLGHLAHVEQPNGLLWTWLTERLVPHCDEIFVVSRFLQRRFGGVLLHHGADTTYFDPARWPSDEARHQLNLPPGRYVVFTGSPMRNKGLGDLLEAVSTLPADVRVLLVGSFAHDPAYGEALTRRYKERLLYVGPRPHREMPLYLAAADVVALPQQPCRETQAQVPGKVFEAMAMGKPIVATDVGDLREILDGCGAVVEPGSGDALRAALLDVLDNPDRAQDLGSRARRRCLEAYNWDAMDRTLQKHLARWERE
jgi:glycosyltransferase involved in cell wall biosynthesis